MIELAVNYSPEAAALVREGAVCVDRFKVPGPGWDDTLALASALLPTYVHFTFSAGSGSFSANRHEVERLLASTATPYVNLHLAGAEKEPGDPSVAWEALVRDVRQAVDAFGPARVIVEHVPYGIAGRGVPRWVAEPTLLCRVVQELDCGFVLDLAHARIAAQAMGISAQDYVNSLPLHALRELHASGVFELPDGPCDHGPLLDADWALLEWVMDEIGSGRWTAPWALAFEYGGVSGEIFRANSRADVLAEQLPRLRDLVDRCNARQCDATPERTA